MRLRNRMVNAEFYTDPDLLRWPSAKRDLYRSLWALAEDSYCVEDDPFGWKCSAWPSPLDAKTHTVAKFTTWREELIAEKKAVPYESVGGHYLFLPDMAEHEHPRNPQSPNLPLPAWVTWEQHASDLRKGAYVIDWRLYNACTTVKSEVLTVPVLSCPVLSEDLGQNPGPSTSAQVQRLERGSYPQAKAKTGLTIPQKAYLEGKIGHELSRDEIATFSRFLAIPGVDLPMIANGIEVAGENGRGLDLGYIHGCLINWTTEGARA